MNQENYTITISKKDLYDIVHEFEKGQKEMAEDTLAGTSQQYIIGEGAAEKVEGDTAIRIYSQNSRMGFEIVLNQESMGFELNGSICPASYKRIMKTSITQEEIKLD